MANHIVVLIHKNAFVKKIKQALSWRIVSEWLEYDKKIMYNITRKMEGIDPQILQVSL
jgi:hypothetical protein